MLDVDFHVIGQLEAALNFQIRVEVADGYYFSAPSPSTVWILRKAECLEQFSLRQDSLCLSPYSSWPSMFSKTL